MLKVGDEYEENGVIIKIESFTPHFSPSGKRSLEVNYRIIHGRFKSAKNRTWLTANTDIKQKAKEIIERYLDTLSSMRTL